MGTYGESMADRMAAQEKARIQEIQEKQNALKAKLKVSLRIGEP